MAFKMTMRAAKVLGAFATDPAPKTGADISLSCKILSGSLYPLLIGMEKAGYLTSRWEDGEPVKLGRPRRRYYEITEEGREAWRAAVATLAPERA